MAILRNTSFNGVTAEAYAVGRSSLSTYNSVTGADQAMVYEKLTGRDASTGAGTAPVNTVHTHAETGNIMLRPLAAWQFGTRGPNGVYSSTAAVTTFAAPLIFQETTATTPVSDFLAMAPLFYVPASMINRDLVLILDCAGDPDMYATARDSAGTAVTGYANMRLIPTGSLSNSVVVGFIESSGIAEPYACTFQVTSAGLYYLDVRTNLRAVDGTRIVYGGVVMMAPDITRIMQGSITPWEDAPDGTNPVPVGDVDNANAWHPMDSALATPDAPMSTAFTTIAQANNTFLGEKAMGTITPGNISPTVPGHAHTGANGDGPEIECNHWGVTKGGYWGSTAEVYGAGANAPYVYNDIVASVFAKGRVYMPNSANVTIGTSKVKFAVLLYGDTGKGNLPKVNVTFGATTKSFQHTGAAPTTQVVSTPTAGNNEFAYTANGAVDFSVELITKAPAGSVGECRVLSACIYVSN